MTEAMGKTSFNDFNEFCQILNHAATDSLFQLTRKHTEVSVLLLLWEDDNLGIRRDVETLGREFSYYHFNTEIYSIPGKSSQIALQRKIIEFLSTRNHPQSLLIIHYCGHGNRADFGRAIWSAGPGPKLVWSDIRGILENAEADVAFLVDCCHALSAANLATQGGSKEGLWACASPTKTYVGSRSFTNNLITVLREQYEQQFSLSMLHFTLMRKHKQGFLVSEPLYTYMSCRKAASVDLSVMKPRQVNLHNFQILLNEPKIRIYIKVELAPRGAQTKRWKWIDGISPDWFSCEQLEMISGLVRLVGNVHQPGPVLEFELPVSIHSKLPKVSAISSVAFQEQTVGTMLSNMTFQPSGENGNDGEIGDRVQPSSKKVKTKKKVAFR